METKIEDGVIAYAKSLHESLERVEYTDFNRFRALHVSTYRIMMGRDPFSITTRRAFNKYRAIAIHDDATDIYAGVLVLSFAADLDPTVDYLEVPL